MTGQKSEGPYDVHSKLELGSSGLIRYSKGRVNPHLFEFLVTSVEKAQYQAALLALSDELKLSLESGKENLTPVSPDAAIGRLTRQDAMQAQQMALELERRTRQRLAQVEAALLRLAEGSYGICTRCDEEISAARLAVKPEAHQCVRCAR